MHIKRPQSISSQINAILRHRIREGIYAPGSKLPSESDLAAELGISRATLRQAMMTLVSEGILQPRQGNGTYVSRRVFEISTRMEDFWSFTHLIQSSGRECTLNVLSTRVRPALQKECDLLEILPHEMVYEMRRLFLADSQPVILSTNIIPASFFKEGTQNCLADQPLDDFIETYCDQQVAYSTSDITSQITDDAAAQILQMPAGAPVLHFQDVFYNRADQPVTLGNNLYADKRLNIRLVRARVV